MRGVRRLRSKRRREKESIVDRGSSRSRNQRKLGMDVHMDLCQKMKLGEIEDQVLVLVFFFYVMHFIVPLYK